MGLFAVEANEDVIGRSWLFLGEHTMIADNHPEVKVAFEEWMDGMAVAHHRTVTSFVTTILISGCYITWQNLCGIKQSPLAKIKKEKYNGTICKTNPCI